MTDASTTETVNATRVTAAKLQDCRDTAHALLNLLQKGIRARSIMTRNV